MVESSLGTFRVEKELWTKFQGLAKSGGSNASQAIVGFIQACIDGSIDIKNYTSIKPKPKAEADNLDEVIDAYLDKNLDARINHNLDTCIHTYLDKNLDQLMGERLDKIDFQKMVDESIMVALEPITVSVSEAEDYTKSQIEKVREELMSVKKHLAGRIDNLESIVTTQPTTQTTTPTPANKTRQPRTSSEPELPALQDVIDLKFESLSWKTFMLIVGLDPSEKANASTAGQALEFAAGLGVPVSSKNTTEAGWYYTPDKNFKTRQPKAKAKTK